MEIHWRNLDEVSPETREMAEARLEALADERDDLIDVRLTGQHSQHHRHGGCEVRIVCMARGREIVAHRTRDDVELALNESLDAFEREVRRMRERRTQRRSERAPEPPILGVVDRILREDGYGFILTDAGEQVYFHRNAVSHGLEFGELEEGQRVGLNVEAGEQGPQASVVLSPPPDAAGT